MSDEDKKPRPGFMGSAKSGMGWAVGFGAVMGVASTLRQGSSPTFKAAIKTFIRAKHGVAEASERARDLYAEAHSEYHADMGSDAADPVAPSLSNGGSAGTGSAPDA